MSGIFVVLEERDGRVSRASWEALAAGQHLAATSNEPVSAVVLGANTDATSLTLGRSASGPRNSATTGVMTNRVGVGSSTSIVPTVINKVVGTKFHLVEGYR